jgi:peptidoglycan/xylan/chitin deacetylase (PgdA/CDA1 family)
MATVARRAALAMLGASGSLIGLGYGLRNIVEEPDRSKLIALTFDDGPSPYADRLLGILNHYNARATFSRSATKSRRTRPGPNALP